MREVNDILNQYSFKFYTKLYENCNSEEQHFCREYLRAEANELNAVIALLDAQDPLVVSFNIPSAKDCLYRTKNGEVLTFAQLVGDEQQEQAEIKQLKELLTDLESN